MGSRVGYPARASSGCGRQGPPRRLFRHLKGIHSGFSQRALARATVAFMTTSPVRAGVSSRSRGPQTFETGLHADADFGTVNVGLAVDAGTFGVVIVAPVVGRLRAAFDVSADGSTRLTSLARQTAEGVDVQVSLFDEAKTQALKVELQQTRDDYAQLAGGNDDLSQRLAQTGAELEVLRRELDAGMAALTREVNEARSAHDAVESERARLSDKLSELTTTLGQRSQELNAGNIAQAQMSTELEASTDTRLALQRDLDRLKAGERQLTAARDELKRELTGATAAEVALTQELSTLRTATGHAHESQVALINQLDEAKVARELLETERDALKAELEESKAARERLEQEAADARTTLQAELEQRSADLNEGSAARERLEQELEELRSSTHGERTSAEQAMIELRDALAKKEKQLSSSASERHELVGQHEETLASLRSSLSSAENDAAGYSSELAGQRAASSIEIDRLTRAVTGAQTMLESRDAELGASVERHRAAEQERKMLREQVEQASAQAQHVQNEFEQTRQALGEAQRLATEHETANASLKAERNEARNVARNLHQRIAGGGGVEALKAELTELRSSLDSAQTNVTNVMAERDRAQLQIESLGRQIDQERSARAKAVVERDQYRDRFRALTSNANTGETKAVTSQDETKSYASTNDFSGEGPMDLTTDVTHLPADFDKTKKKKD